MEQCFSIDNIFNDQSQRSFLEYSSIKVKNIVDENICKEACEYIYTNEEKIINLYEKDKRGLTVDVVENKKYIKYFEYPLKENHTLFGKFVTSDIFKIAQHLIGTSVYLKSVEIHSRCAKGTPIPPHQDNAYYGLKNARALTFYIPINNEFAGMGGLKYYKNPYTYELEHKPSDASGFSLAVANPNTIPYKTFDPDYSPGDCTIHHARSVHFADEVPYSAERSLVVRLQLHALNETMKEGHLEWYSNMIKRNREIVSKSQDIKNK